MSGDLHKDLSTALVEKDVESTYRSYLEKYYKTKVESPYDTDGLLKTTLNFDKVSKKLILIMEYKLNENFNSSINVSKVLVQVLYYIKKFEENGDDFPNIVLVGDRKTAFVLHSNGLLKYLKEGVDWSIAPSEAARHVSTGALIQKINNDEDINPFIFNINPDFDFNQVTNRIDMLTENIIRLVPITPQNIARIYDYFIKQVVHNYSQYEANDLVSIFISVMLNKEASFLLPKKNILVINDTRQIAVNAKAYNAFFRHFQQDYKPEERRKFTEIADRLIEETNRRKKGEYYTPTAFVQYADERLQKKVGYRWKDTHIVWDSAWGTGNLTRDFSIRKLFASTLNKTDLDMGMKYNRQAEQKFEYDFLNDDPSLFDNMALLQVESHKDDEPTEYKKHFKMPQKLMKYLSDSTQNILFFINPPYATGGNANSKEVKSKKDLGKTVVGNMMRSDKMIVSEQLYAQFLYRILLMKRHLDLNNVYIGLYSPTLFLTGSKYKAFREEFLKDFTFVDGSIFKADHFADVQGNWAIDFSIWKSKKSISDTPLPTEFKHNILNLNEYGQVEIVGEKILWNLDNDVSLQEWIGQTNDKGIELVDKPVFSSSFKSKGQLKSIRVDSLGCLINDTNNVEASTKGSYLLPNKTTRNLKSIPLIHENFAKGMVVLTVRNIYKANWINQKNEFSAPDTIHPLYKKFEVLSVIYSIFSTKNNVISYRRYKVKDNYYDHINEWFFISNNEMRQLANESNNVDVYDDSISYSGERYVFEYLKENSHLISDNGKLIIDKAKEIIQDTFRFRYDYHNDNNSDKYINTWDASWAQIKLLGNLFTKGSMDDFNQYYKLLEVELLEMAEQLGFMKYK